jgi:hypothetical protein
MRLDSVCTLAMHCPWTSRESPTTLVGDVVMKQEIIPFLRAARERGGVIQVGTDMLFEQIPAYLEFFGFPTTTADELRAVAKMRYWRATLETSFGNNRPAPTVRKFCSR